MKRRRLVFATNNQHKLKELREIVGESMEILSLSDIGCEEELPETAPTIAGNAEMKARYVAERYLTDCFADDTGLEVEALGGAPGVHTARYATACGHDTLKNMELLLRNLKGKENRKAAFRTVIALAEHTADGKTKVKLFEGVCSGEITEAPQGEHGFGYDPVFCPEGCCDTFAMMEAEKKNELSHRGRATKALLEYLQQEQTPVED